jgi:hypothetical protein
LRLHSLFPLLRTIRSHRRLPRRPPRRKPNRQQLPNRRRHLRARQRRHRAGTRQRAARREAGRVRIPLGAAERGRARPPAEILESPGRAPRQQVAIRQRIRRRTVGVLEELATMLAEIPQTVDAAGQPPTTGVAAQRPTTGMAAQRPTMGALRTQTVGTAPRI